MENIYQVIKRPIISEKSAFQGETLHTYAFEVGINCNRQQIRVAVEKLFHVDVENVRTLIVHGQYKRTARSHSKRSNWKKAIVKVKEGQQIEFFKG